jgi:uncharacterized CHY-type Zn-finger protein
MNVPFTKLTFGYEKSYTDLYTCSNCNDITYPHAYLQYIKYPDHNEMTGVVLCGGCYNDLMKSK